MRQKNPAPHFLIQGILIQCLDCSLYILFTAAKYIYLFNIYIYIYIIIYIYDIYINIAITNINHKPYLLELCSPGKPTGD